MFTVSSITRFKIEIIQKTRCWAIARTTTCFLMS